VEVVRSLVGPLGDRSALRLDCARSEPQRAVVLPEFGEERGKVVTARVELCLLEAGAGVLVVKPHVLVEPVRDAEHHPGENHREEQHNRDHQHHTDGWGDTAFAPPGWFDHHSNTYI
jgi:hypothetical protein